MYYLFKTLYLSPHLSASLHTRMQFEFPLKHLPIVVAAGTSHWTLSSTAIDKFQLPAPGRSGCFQNGIKTDSAQIITCLLPKRVSHHVFM